MNDVLLFTSNKKAVRNLEKNFILRLYRWRSRK